MTAQVGRGGERLRSRRQPLRGRAEGSLQAAHGVEDLLRVAVEVRAEALDRPLEALAVWCARCLALRGRLEHVRAAVLGVTDAAHLLLRHEAVDHRREGGGREAEFACELSGRRTPDDVQPARQRVLRRGDLAPVDDLRDQRTRELRHHERLQEETRLDSSTISYHFSSTS
jgi:hypothetical protein